MSIRDIKANLDAYTESLMKSGVVDASPAEALEIISDYMAKVCGSIGSIVWYCGADGEEFARTASVGAVEALQNAFGPSIKEAEFDSPIGHNSRQRLQGTHNSRQQGLERVHGARL